MKFKFILSEPRRPANIGSAARALCTMGFSDMILVNPHCDYLSGETMASAHLSEHVLTQARAYPTLKAVLDSEKIDLLVGTTARHRQKSCEYIDCRELPGFLSTTCNSESVVGILFGCESSGLSNAELSLCNVSSNIALAGSQPSLNLAQAVMIYSYVLSVDCKPLLDQRTITKQVGVGEANHLRQASGLLLERLGFSKTEREYSKIMSRLSHVSGSDLRLMQKVRGRIEAVLSGR